MEQYPCRTKVRLPILRRLAVQTVRQLMPMDYNFQCIQAAVFHCLPQRSLGVEQPQLMRLQMAQAVVQEPYFQYQEMVRLVEQPRVRVTVRV